MDLIKNTISKFKKLDMCQIALKSKFRLICEGQNSSFAIEVIFLNQKQ